MCLMVSSLIAGNSLESKLLPRAVMYLVQSCIPLEYVLERLYASRVSYSENV